MNGLLKQVIDIDIVNFCETDADYIFNQLGYTKQNSCGGSKDIVIYIEINHKYTSKDVITTYTSYRPVSKNSNEYKQDNESNFEFAERINISEYIINNNIVSDIKIFPYIKYNYIDLISKKSILDVIDDTIDIDNILVTSIASIDTGSKLNSYFTNYRSTMFTDIFYENMKIYFNYSAMISLLAIDEKYCLNNAYNFVDTGYNNPNLGHGMHNIQYQKNFSVLMAVINDTDTLFCSIMKNPNLSNCAFSILYPEIAELRGTNSYYYYSLMQALFLDRNLVTKNISEQNMIGMTLYDSAETLETEYKKYIIGLTNIEERLKVLIRLVNNFNLEYFLNNNVNVFDKELFMHKNGEYRKTYDQSALEKIIELVIKHFNLEIIDYDIKVILNNYSKLIKHNGKYHIDIFPKMSEEEENKYLIDADEFFIFVKEIIYSLIEELTKSITDSITEYKSIPMVTTAIDSINAAEERTPLGITLSFAKRIGLEVMRDVKIEENKG